MSCNSLFEFIQGLTYTYNATLNFNQSFTIPGYTTPSFQIKYPNINPAAFTTSGGDLASCTTTTTTNTNTWSGLNSSTTTSGWNVYQTTYTTKDVTKHYNVHLNPSNLYTTSTTTVPGIELWPSIVLTINAPDVPLTFTSIAGIGVTIMGTTPIGASNVTIEPCTIQASISIGNATIPMTIPIVTPVELGVNDVSGQMTFDVELPLSSNTWSYSYPLPSDQSVIVAYTFTINTNIIFCLNPEGGAGTVNLQIEFIIAYNFVYDNNTISDSMIASYEIPVVPDITPESPP